MGEILIQSGWKVKGGEGGGGGGGGGDKKMLLYATNMLYVNFHVSPCPTPFQ